MTYRIEIISTDMHTRIYTNLRPNFHLEPYRIDIAVLLKDQYPSSNIVFGATRYSYYAIDFTDESEYIEFKLRMI